MFDEMKTFFLFLLTLSVFVIIGIFGYVLMHFDGMSKVYVWSILTVYIDVVMVLLFYTWYRDFFMKRVYEFLIFVITTLIVVTSSVLFYSIQKYYS